MVSESCQKKTENQDISGIDMDDCSDSEVNISEEN